MGFDKIVICFDNDEPGQQAANQVAELFGSKAHIFRFKQAEIKDANDYLIRGLTKEFVEQWWDAEKYVPDGIVAGSTLWDLVNQPVDPNLIRNVLYKFDRPLTMVEINNILNATSNPISIGRRDDPLSTIPAHIKSINIDSVIKQTAKFDLRSNKILR